MKTFMFMSAVLLGIAGTGTHADAQNYPWCARCAKGGDTENCDAARDRRTSKRVEHVVDASAFGAGAIWA
jgi:hypothetical protein